VSDGLAGRADFGALGDGWVGSFLLLFDVVMNLVDDCQ